MCGHDGQMQVRQCPPGAVYQPLILNCDWTSYYACFNVQRGKHYTIKYNNKIFSSVVWYQF